MSVKISVVMPVFNMEKFIVESIKSILWQSYTNFELIIIDDGSKDNTVKLVESFKDKRIKFLKNKVNIGLSPSLNRGVKASKGKYIARCDGDDINEKDRFKTQLDFLEADQDYVAVGSNALVINQEGTEIGEIKSPQSDQQILENLIIRNNILHPSAMIKTKAIKHINAYRMLFNAGGEDYDLWFRLAKVGKLYNIQKNLIKRRLHAGVYTKKFHLRIEFFALLIRLIHLPVWIYLVLDRRLRK